MVFVLNNWSKLRIDEDFTLILLLLLMKINSQRKAKTFHRTLSSKTKVTTTTGRFLAMKKNVNKIKQI